LKTLNFFSEIIEYAVILSLCLMNDKNRIILA